MATVTTIGGNRSDPSSQKYSSIPIFRLPPETLAEIFTRCARDHYESDKKATFRTPHWVNVSYVCRYWRDVALDCPALWTYHFTVSLRWTEELLARSKQASLKIRVRFDPKRTAAWWSGLVETLLNHAERVQELRLHVPRGVLPPKLTLCAPRLQHLEIDGYWGRPSEWTSAIHVVDIPALRTVTLADCLLPWDLLQPSGVTVLFLRGVSAPLQQNMEEVLTTLSYLQGLKVLHLDNALASTRGLPSNRAFNLSAKTALPYLARLFITASLPAAIALVSHVNIPLQTRIRLEFQPEDGSSLAEYAQIPSVLAQRFGLAKDLSLCKPIIRSLTIRSPLYCDSIFTFSASEYDDCDLNPWIGCPLGDCSVCLVDFVGSERPRIADGRDDILSSLCCSIPWTHVQTLHVIHPPLSLDFWRKTFDHLRGLRCLKLSDGFMPNLVSLLAVDNPPAETADQGAGDQARSPGGAYIPALEELELCRIKFDTEDDVPLGDVISERMLFDALSTRKDCCPQLTMIDCGRVEDDYLDMEEFEDCLYSSEFDPPEHADAGYSSFLVQDGYVTLLYSQRYPLVYN